MFTVEISNASTGYTFRQSSCSLLTVKALYTDSSLYNNLLQVSSINKKVLFRCVLGSVILGDSSVLTNEVLQQNVAPGANGSLCLLCGTLLKLQTLPNIRRHFEDKHTYGESYHCPLCGGNYRSKNSFKTHIYMNHRDAMKGVDISKFRAKL